MNNTKTDIYYMESDGAVKIPEKYDKMNLSEITAECVRLSKKKTNQKINGCCTFSKNEINQRLERKIL
jgi:hypothetical protein